MSETATLSDQPVRGRDRLVRLFSVVAIVEAFTWAGLLIGMYVKYVPKTTELGVQIFGRLHGGVFVLYVVLAILVALRLRWPVRWTALFALAAAVPPFATVVFEVWARRNGRLDPVRAQDGSRSPELG